MVFTTLGRNIDGFRKVCHFQLFIMFDWSGPAIFLVFELSQSVLVIHQECSQSTQDTSGPHQDGGYHSWKGYCWFLVGLFIFDFS